MSIETNTIHTGDTFDVLPTLPAASVHAVVTDPPYGLAFMGRDWDAFEPREYQEWCEEWASAVKRVLKPGGHLLAFSGNRTHHRLFSGVEDAGYEIRDTVTWHYGSGFPKALDVSKAIDKAADAERTEGKRVWKGGERQGGDWSNSERRGEGTTEKVIYDQPATDAAERWDGFKTALKPATEYVVLARKPLSEGTVAENVQTHGTGALNIDGTRIGTEERFNGPANPGEETFNQSYDTDYDGQEVEGRYPSNVVFDETEAERLDREVGESSSNVRKATGKEKMNPDGTSAMREMPTPDTQDRGFNDSGGPSRYFYTSKASKAERTEGGSITNDHPTVKPLDLAEWLVRLVTAEGQIVLDPFAGSGTIPKAAKQLGRQFVGIEQQPKYADVARVRCGLTPEDPAHVREDDGQRGFEAYTDGGDAA